MSHQVVPDNSSANESVFSTNYIDSPAAIATKKIIDIGSRCLKASNKKLHFCNSAIPIVGFVVSLIGLVLQAYATFNDKGKPKWLKGLALCVLGATAALTVSIFVLSVQFPPIALALSFAVIGIGVVMQVIDFMYSLSRLFVAKYKVIFPSQKDNSDKIKKLNSKRVMLFKQQTSLTSVISHEDDGEKLNMLQSRLKKVQLKTIKTENKIQQLKDPVCHINKEYSKEKRKITGSCFSLSTCIGSSILGVIGLTLAVGNPPLGIAIIALGLVFDAIILSRKVNKWMNRREKEKKKKNEFDRKSKILSIESVNYLDAERVKIKQSFAGVMRQLNSEDIRQGSQNIGKKPTTTIKSVKSLSVISPYTNDFCFDSHHSSNEPCLIKK